MQHVARRRATPAVATASAPRTVALEGAAFRLFIGYLVLAFTTSASDQFALPKLLGLSAYTTLAAAAWIVDLRRSRVGRLPSPLVPLAAAMAVWWTVATATAQHFATALLGMAGRHDGLATMLAGLVLFLVLATTRSSDREVEGHVAAIAIALTAASAYALVQAAGLDPIPWPSGRPASTLGHPVVLGGALALGLPLSVAFALEGRSRFARAAWSGAALVQGLALILTLARGPWIAAVAGLVVFVVLSARRPGRGAARAAGRLGAAALLLAVVLAAWTPVRSAVLDRLSTLGRPAADSSLAYRAHFAAAALAMLSDHPLVGVGWENFGLLYSRYRSPPTAKIAADLVPTMVHCGPLQAAVSGGVPALALHAAFVAAVIAAVARRRRSEADARARRMGDAFLASSVAFVLQDLSGWPHVALGTLAFVLAGLAVAWACARGPRVVVPWRWPLVALAGGVVVAATAGSAFSVQLFQAQRLLFEADGLSADWKWAEAEPKIVRALRVAPDRAWALDGASRLYLRRAAEIADRRAYERGVVLADAAHAVNPFDPYLRLRRTELDLVAMDAGVLATLTEEGRDALLDAQRATTGSVRVARVAASVGRKARGSRIVWIAPSSSVGFGPEGSLVVAGIAPGALPDTKVHVHWRDATRGPAWTAESASVPIDGEGRWYAAIPDADPNHRYDAYATSEDWMFGPCEYAGGGSIGLCAPIALIGPAAPGMGPAGTLLVAGASPAPGIEFVLRWKNASRDSHGVAVSSRSSGRAGAPVFPVDAPGAWYALLPAIPEGESYRLSVSSGGASVASCTQRPPGPRTLCAPLALVGPEAAMGFGPPGTLVVGGYLPQGVPGTPVFLHWRNLTRGSGWITAPGAPSPDDQGNWYNAIPDARPGDRYQIAVSSPTTATPTCNYDGKATVSFCR